MQTDMDDKAIRFVQEMLFNNGDVTALCVTPVNNDKMDEVIDFRPFYREFAVIPHQTHSLNVKVVSERNEWPEDTDALITFERDFSVGIVTADCVPIVVYAPDVKGVGAIHAGWKGTLGGIVDNALDVLQERGADLSQLIVIFGPSISKERYEVDTELGERFREAGFKDYVSYPCAFSKPHIDLQEVNMERFLRRGVKRENIRLHFGCSYDSRREDDSYAYPSHRRCHGSAGRMLTCISLR